MSCMLVGTTTTLVGILAPKARINSLGKLIRLITYL